MPRSTLESLHRPSAAPDRLPRRRWLRRGRAPMLVGTSLAAALSLIVLEAAPAGAHVKWFSDFDFGDPPKSFGEIVTPTFIALAIASTMVISVLVVMERRLDRFWLYDAVNRWLIDRQDKSFTVMRIAMAAVLILSWENRALLTPELTEYWGVIGWYQFLLAAMLFFRPTARYAGVGVVVLWLFGAAVHGPFHMLDYLHYVGIGVFLATHGHRERRVQGLGVPALYATTGFALMWLGFEKLVYPDWGLGVLDEHPMMLFGLPPDFFLQVAAFVEVGLGFLLIIGLLERPLAAVLSLVLFGSTLVFGRVEVVGHTSLHAALLVFLLVGPGNIYPAPIKIAKRVRTRLAFSGVNFALAVLLIGLGYATTARIQYDNAVAAAGDDVGAIDVASNGAPLFDRFVVEPHRSGGSAVRVEVPGFAFVEPLADGASGPAITEPVDAAPAAGMAFVTVDGVPAGYLTDATMALDAFGVGDHTIELELRTVDNRRILVDGAPVEAEIEVSDGVVRVIG